MTSLSFVSADNIRATNPKFSITVTPNPIQQSAPATITIKALNTNGTVDTNYDGVVWIGMLLHHINYYMTLSDEEAYDAIDSEKGLYTYDIFTDDDPEYNGMVYFDPSYKGVITIPSALRIDTVGSYHIFAIELYSEDPEYIHYDGIRRGDITITVAWGGTTNPSTTGTTTTTVSKASFQVSVTPNPMNINSGSTVTVKALKADGSIDTNYKWTIILDLGKNISLNSYTVPNNGFYTFTTADKGVKTFTNSLVIKKEWTYTLTIYDAIQEDILWKTMIQVGKSSTSSSTNTTSSSPKLYKKQYKTFMSFILWEYKIFAFKRSFPHLSKYCKPLDIVTSTYTMNPQACVKSLSNYITKEINPNIQFVNPTLWNLMKPYTKATYTLDDLTNWIANRDQVKQAVASENQKRKNATLSIRNDIMYSFSLISIMKLDYEMQRRYWHNIDQL